MKNKCRIENNVGVLMIQHKGQSFDVLVDETDLPLIADSYWHINQSSTRTYIRGYIGNEGQKRQQYLHRHIMQVIDPLVEVDHRNRDGLDNRRQNLRICDRGKNSYNAPARSNNRSGYKGVRWHQHNQMWEARIASSKVQRSLGYFRDVVEAAKAYDRASHELHGEFARPNFPLGFNELLVSSDDPPAHDRSCSLLDYFPTCSRVISVAFR
jgi:hypothetical protein